jgi:hypothetical protein
MRKKESSELRQDAVDSLDLLGDLSSGSLLSAVLFERCQVLWLQLVHDGPVKLDVNLAIVFVPRLDARIQWLEEEVLRNDGHLPLGYTS